MSKHVKLVLILLIAFSIGSYAQQGNDKKGAKEPVVITGKMPQFPGGDKAFYAYLDKNVVLPDGFDKEKYFNEHHNQYVPVSVGFTVDVDGSIIDLKVIDGEDELLDQKAREIVEKMPKWEPGYQDGSPVKVQYAIPIRFNLM